MNEIEQDLQEQSNALYLFANDEVLPLYEKLGFVSYSEYQYQREILQQDGIQNDQGTAKPYLLDGIKKYQKLQKAIEEAACNISFMIIHNAELILFYVSSIFCNNVYYIEELDTYAIAEITDGKLLLYDVYAKAEVNLDDVARSFGSNIHTLILGFTPIHPDDYMQMIHREEDTTLFTKGFNLDNKHSMFPLLSHA